MNIFPRKTEQSICKELHNLPADLADLRSGSSNTCTVLAEP